MTLGHVHVMCILLAVKFLLAVGAAISPEFMHWYPHPTVSATPHGDRFTLITTPIKDSTNKVPEAHRSIVKLQAEKDFVGERIQTSGTAVQSVGLED